MPAPGSPPPVPPGVIRRGLRILWTGVREEPRIFAISATGSALFALTTIGQAYVFGAITERVIVPGIRDGNAPAAGLALAFLAILGMTTLKIIGILARRLGAGSCSTASRRPTASA